MTTPGGVSNLPAGALTLDNISDTLHDMSPAAMRSRVVERMPDIFHSSMGGDPASDYSFFGFLTQLWAGFNSAVANADPADITGPNDLPGLLVNFIEDLPIIGDLIRLLESIVNGDFEPEDVLTTIENVFNTLASMLGLPAVNFDADAAFEWFAENVPVAADLVEAMQGTYAGDDAVLLGIQQIFAPIRQLLALVSGQDVGLPSAEEITSGWEDLADSIGQKLGELLNLDFSSPEAFIDSLTAALGDLGAAVQPLIDAFVNTFLGLGGTGHTVNDVIRAIQSIPGQFLTGTLSPGLASHLNVGTLSGFLPEFLTNGNFDTPDSLIGQSVWFWDGTTGPPGVSTSVYTDLSGGVLAELFSNNVNVTAGQQLAISGLTKYQGVAAGSSIALTIAKYDVNNTLIGYDTPTGMAIASPSGTQSTWQTLSATYTVPSGVASIFVRPTAAGTAGRVWFGKLSAKPTGTSLLTSLVPLLDASKIGSGQFAQSFVQGLTTMFGGLSSGSSITSQLGLNNIGDLGAIIDQLTNGMVGAGTSFTNSNPSQARGSIDSMFNTVLDTIKSVQAMLTDALQTAFSGFQIGIDFSNYPDGPIPSQFTNTYVGSGTSALGVKSGVAQWTTLNNDANRAAYTMYNVQPTATDFQQVKGTMGSPPQQGGSGGTPYVYAIGNADSPTNPQNYRWARAYSTGFLTYKGDVGYTVAGVETVLESNIPLSWSMDITVNFGAQGNIRRIQVFSGTGLVADVIEPGTAAMIGPGYRYWGARTEMKTS